MPPTRRCCVSGEAQERHRVGGRSQAQLGSRHLI